MTLRYEDLARALRILQEKPQALHHRKILRCDRIMLKSCHSESKILIVMQPCILEVY